MMSSKNPVQGEMYQMPMYPTPGIPPMPNYPVQAEMYHAPMPPHHTAQMPVHYVCPVNPYVFQALCTLIGHKVVIETVNNKHVGKLKDVKPDHIVLECMDAVFFIRIQEIVSIMPIQHCHSHKKHHDSREAQNS